MKRSALLIGNFLSSSLGNRSVCEDLAVKLTAAGWSVLTASARPARLARLLDMTLTVWHGRHRYDVTLVDVYSGRAFLWAEIVCCLLRRLSKSYILTLHGGNLPLFARRWPGRVRHLLLSAAVVTVPSRYLLENMMPYRADLQLLPNPVELSAHKFRLREQPQPRLIWLRSFHTMYNPQQAPQVLANLKHDFPDIHLTMIGPDKGDGSLPLTHQLAVDLGVDDRIIFLGRVDKSEVVDWLNKGDIFLNTTNIDNTPISILEAMACGLCVISTNVGGIPYLLAHEQDALLVPPNSPEGMAASVRRVLTEPGLAEQLSRNGHQKVAQFDWSVILPQWEALLTSVIEGKMA